MSRHRFLGTMDLSTTTSLLTNYNVPTKIPNGVKLHRIKHQDDLILIELGSLLTSNECDEILATMRTAKFEDMSHKYDVSKRNNSRLIVMDDRLGRTLWRRLKFGHKLTKLVQNTRPLGFNVEGTWQLSGVNPAMRVNQYNEREYFARHKDAQYAPSGDERSLFSLIIYLNDDYKQGETKFYFPKVQPTSDPKGLTIREEIHVHGGLQNGYECLTIKPTKGHAVLFTHKLLHEAMAPERANAVQLVQRFVLRTDVLVKRTGKLLGFAICPEEKEDYLTCLNYFREAQQNELKESSDSGTVASTITTGELYERSLSIRYCYPRLLQSMVKQDVQSPLVNRLPIDVWVYISKYLHEQELLNFIYAYPKFQLLKLIWQAQETKQLQNDSLQEKFIPTIGSEYGCHTLFHFPDANFFFEHLHGCCRVAAVYAFYLLAHGKDSQTYTVRFDRNTHDAYEVKMEKLFADVFYNRNCYGSLYRVKQKDANERQAMVDLDASVDRTYMANRHQAQFIGQDLLSRLHLKVGESSVRPSHCSRDDEDESLDYYGHMNGADVLAYQRRTALRAYKNEIVNSDSDGEETKLDPYTKDHILGYREQLLKQTEQTSSTSICQMLSAKVEDMKVPLRCTSHDYEKGKFADSIEVYNHLIFDFDTHQLAVEKMVDQGPSSFNNQNDSDGSLKTLSCAHLRKDGVSHYRVNIEKLAKEIRGFNHASMSWLYPPELPTEVDQFSFLHYTYLSHVCLEVTREDEGVSVLATYGGAVAL